MALGVLHAVCHRNITEVRQADIAEILDYQTKGVAKSDEFSEKCQRGGGGVIFNPKICVADFGNFKQDFLSMKLIQTSNFRVQGICFQQLY